MIRIRGAAPVTANEDFVSVFYGFYKNFPGGSNFISAYRQIGITIKKVLKN
jgi:hypothetical protein